MKIKVNMDDFGSFLNSIRKGFAVTDRRKLIKIKRSGENMGKMTTAEFEAALRACKVKHEYVPAEGIIKVSHKDVQGTIRYEEVKDDK